MYLNVSKTPVALTVEMFPNFTTWPVMANAVKMGLESVHQPILGLANVLYTGPQGSWRR